MKALVHRGPGRFAIEERPAPRPGPGEVLLRPLFAGVCVSDKHVYDGLPFGPEWRDGLVIGHEFVAAVEEPGEGVEGFAVGDRVTVDPRIYCHHCPKCEAGLPTLCEDGAEWLGVAGGRDGGFAELCLAPAYGLFPLPDGVPEPVGAMIEPLACVSRCLHRSGLRPGDEVAVLGAEDYGLLAVARLAAGGARTVAVVDPSEIRREAAIALGASIAIDPGAGSAARALREVMPNGADLTLVAMEDYVEAATDYLRLAFRAARVQGTVAVLRAYGAAPYARIDPQVPYLKEITVRHAGVFFGQEPIRGGRSGGDWAAALAAAAAGEVGELPGTQVVGFSALEDPAVVAKVFSAYPERATKTLVEINA